MTDRARAAVLRGERHLTIEEFGVPRPSPDSATLDIEICGVCGSDYEAFRRPPSEPFAPVVLGHEAVGRIRAIGAEAARRWGCDAGDRVVVNEVIPCGQCRLCARGAGELCNGFFGTSGQRYGNIPVTVPPALWGGFATVMNLHPRSQLVRIGDHVPADAAAVFMPLANGVHWLSELGRVRPGDDVLVVGPGPQGLAVAAVASRMPGVRVTVAGLPGDSARLKLAEELGAASVAGDAADVIAAVSEQTGGTGADVVVLTTSGATSVLRIATRCAATGARIVVAGTNGWQNEEGFKPDALVFRNLELIGAAGHSWSSVRRAVRLLEDDPSFVQPLVGPPSGLDDLLGILDRQTQPSRGVHVAIRPGQLTRRTTAIAGDESPARLSWP